MKIDLFDLYKLIEKMQTTIGNGCRVSISVSRADSLEICTDWIDSKIHIRFLRHHHFAELRAVYDTNVILDLYCLEAQKEYKRAINENRHSDE